MSISISTSNINILDVIKDDSNNIIDDNVQDGLSKMMSKMKSR